MKRDQGALLLGIFIILFVAFIIGGFYVFYNAKGFSYFSSNSAACDNCHVMDEVYKDWQRGAHGKGHEVDGKMVANAKCIDCHLPHEFLPKWIEKARAGLHHSYAFTFVYPDLPTHLSANKRTKKIVQNNCMRCHKTYASHAINATTNPKLGNGMDALNCVSCHRNAGHKHAF